MPASTVRRSLVRGVVAMLFVVLATVSAAEPDPVVLHVIGRGNDTAETTTSDGAP